MRHSRKQCRCVRCAKTETVQGRERASQKYSEEFQIKILTHFIRSFCHFTTLLHLTLHAEPANNFKVNLLIILKNTFKTKHHLRRIRCKVILYIQKG